MSKNNDLMHLKQRALVLGGGGSLGAYEVGALKALCKKIREDDSELTNKKDRLLFDIVAGTSIGATNAVILVSQFLQTKSWDDAIEKLQSFWLDTKRGLASNPVQEDLEKVPGYTKWKEASDNNNLAASKEASRRYYSARYFLLHGVPNMYVSPYQQRYAFKFFDDESDLTKWYIHSIQPLQDTLKLFAHFPLATNFDKNEPRLLIFSVDVAEGETVTFDSYERSDGGRRSEYGKYNAKQKEYENVISYNEGIGIDHVMASNTVPEFYDYREIDGHKFWDGGMLSNTPFRETFTSPSELLEIC